MNPKTINLPKIPTEYILQQFTDPDDLDKLHQEFDTEDMYEVSQADRIARWTKVVSLFENEQSLYNSWQYLNNHPIYYFFDGKVWNEDRIPNRFHEYYLQSDIAHIMHAWEIDPHLVNPATDMIDKDGEKNTKLRWWMESGPLLWGEDPNLAGSPVRGHDPDLDCGADTYEEALIKLAKRVHDVYGNDRRKVVEIWNDSERPLREK